jgi:hypothetical protein
MGRISICHDHLQAAGIRRRSFNEHKGSSTAPNYCTLAIEEQRRTVKIPVTSSETLEKQEQHILVAPDYITLARSHKTGRNTVHSDQRFFDIYFLLHLLLRHGLRSRTHNLDRRSLQFLEFEVCYPEKTKELVPSILLDFD